MVDQLPQNFWRVNIFQLWSELPAHNVQVTQPRVNSVIKIDIVSIEKKSQMSSSEGRSNLSSEWPNAKQSFQIQEKAFRFCTLV